METRIHGYDVIEELNKGAFCDAYKVRKGGTDYFLKLYKDPTVMSADYEDFKKNQAKMIPLLKSLGSQVETIIEDFEEEGRYYQVKEFIPGATNLRDWLETSDNYDDRLDVAIQFCTILKAVHEKGIIHQDLKPEQVMTVRDHSHKSGIRLILTDFDWSIVDGKVVRYVGTPGYNNIDGTNVSYKSDIFTLGIILCELLTGCNPYVVSESEERIYEPTKWVEWVKKKDFKAPIAINDELPEPINEMIVKCLEPDPKNRPAIGDIISVLINPFPRLKALLLSPSGESMIMVPGNGYGRQHFKELFSRTTDTDSNPVYMYLDKSYATLYLVQEKGELKIGCPSNGKAKNKIQLNGSDMSDTPETIKNGDKVSIFSTGKSEIIVTFNIEIK